MINVDCLIVGQGVAGSCMALKLLQENKSFHVIDDHLHKASAIAAGIYNPIVLKRFAIVWNAQYQIDLLRQVFLSFEELLGKKYIHEMPVYRIFNDENEKKTWLKKAAKPELESFLSTDFSSLDSYTNVTQKLGTGEVLQTGRIDLTNLLADFKNYLLAENRFTDETFSYDQLKLTEHAVVYKEIQAKTIIFAEGYNILNNPYFKNLPIIGNKGEVLKIKLKANLPQAVIKTKEFLMPLGNDDYFVGATYERNQVDYELTTQAKDYLTQGIHQFIEDDFQVIDHQASIRPTVVDRRPIIGCHPSFPQLVCLNGMGTRGTMLAPAMVEELYSHLTLGTAIDKEADISRFNHLLIHENI